MVDSIKNLGSSGTRPTTSSLRSSFKSLSSASVKDASRPASAEEADKAVEMLSELNEAVSYSAKAVKSLEHISKAATGSDAVPVSEEDINRLRDDIDRVKSRVDVASENMRSAGSKLADVDAAQSQAVKTGYAINFASSDALDAHKLSPAKVAQLLFD